MLLLLSSFWRTLANANSEQVCICTCSFLPGIFDLTFCICQLGYFIIDFKTEIEVSSIFVERKEDLYLDYTTLAEFILSRKITPKECYYILRQIALGICFLHQKNVTMRTKICPDNVFIFMSKNVSTSLN